MVFDKTIWIGIGIVVALYLLYKIFFGSTQFKTEFESDYNKILDSEEYKVKGQYEK